MTPPMQDVKTESPAPIHGHQSNSTTETASQRTNAASTPQKRESDAVMSPTSPTIDDLKASLNDFLDSSAKVTDEVTSNQESRRITIAELKTSLSQFQAQSSMESGSNSVSSVVSGSMSPVEGQISQTTQVGVVQRNAEAVADDVFGEYNVQ